MVLLVSLRDRLLKTSISGMSLFSNTALSFVIILPVLILMKVNFLSGDIFAYFELKVIVLA